MAPTPSRGRPPPESIWTQKFGFVVFFVPDTKLLMPILRQGGSGTEPEPETGTVRTVFPETESGTGTAETVFQEPKPELEPSFHVHLC